MDLLAECEENLRALSMEARKLTRLSGVKEAAERGILKVRGLKVELAGFLRQRRKADEAHEEALEQQQARTLVTDAAAAAARSNPANGTAPLPPPPPPPPPPAVRAAAAAAAAAAVEVPAFSFRQPELLQPFLLACNYTDCGPKLTLLSLSGIQHLINRDAMHASDAQNVMRVLAIQAHASGTEVHLRVLQSTLLLVSAPACPMSEELLSQALLVCFSLNQARDSIVHNAASATVRQILGMLFDRVAKVGLEARAAAEQARLKLAEATHKLQLQPQGEALQAEVAVLEKERKAAVAAVESAGLGGVGRCAYLVFQDLCVLSRGEQGVWLKRTSVAPAMGLELVESILSQHRTLFHQDATFQSLVTRQVCPLLLHTLQDHHHRQRTTSRVNGNGTGSDVNGSGGGAAVGGGSGGFPLMVRCMRCCSTLLRDFGHSLGEECEPLLSALLHSLASSSSLLGWADMSGEGCGGGAADTYSFQDNSGGADRVGISSSSSSSQQQQQQQQAERVWASLLILEALHGICADQVLLFKLFKVLDCAEEPGGDDDDEGDGDDGRDENKNKNIYVAAAAQPLAIPSTSSGLGGVSPKAKKTRYPVLLVGNLVHVLTHFVMQGAMNEQGVLLVMHGLKRLSSSSSSSSSGGSGNVGGGKEHRQQQAAQSPTASSLTHPSGASGAAAALSSDAAGEGSSSSSVGAKRGGRAPSSCGGGGGAGSSSSSPVLLVGYGTHSVRDLLLETTAPHPAPQAEALAVGLECLVAVSESLRHLTLEAFGTTPGTATTAARSSSSSSSRARTASSGGSSNASAPLASANPPSDPSAVSHVSNVGTSRSNPATLFSSSPSFSGSTLFMQPPPLSLVFHKRSTSVQTLDEFLKNDDDEDGNHGTATAATAAAAAAAPPAEAECDVVTSSSSAFKKKHSAEVKANLRRQERVREFVSATWENVLMAASQLLLLSQSSAVVPSSSSSSSSSAQAHAPSSSSSTSSNNGSSCSGAGSAPSAATASSSPSSSSSMLAAAALPGQFAAATVAAMASTSSSCAGNTSAGTGSSSSSSLVHGGKSSGLVGGGGGCGDNSRGSSSSGSNSGTGSGGSAAHRRLVDKVLTVYTTFTVSAGLAGLSVPRDCLLGSLCKAALPNPHAPYLGTSSSSSPPLPSSAETALVEAGSCSGGCGGSGGGASLAPHHVAVLKAVLVVTHTLGNSMGPHAWSAVVEALDHLDHHLKRRKQSMSIASSAGSSSSAALSLSPPPPPLRGVTGALSAKQQQQQRQRQLQQQGGGHALSSAEQRLQAVLDRFILFSSALEPSALGQVVDALEHTSRSALNLPPSSPAAELTTPSSTLSASRPTSRPTPRPTQSSSSSGVDSKRSSNSSSSSTMLVPFPKSQQAQTLAPASQLPRSVSNSIAVSAAAAADGAGGKEAADVGIAGGGSSGWGVGGGAGVGGAGLVGRAFGSLFTGVGQRLIGAGCGGGGGGGARDSSGGGGGGYAPMMSGDSAGEAGGGQIVDASASSSSSSSSSSLPPPPAPSSSPPTPTSFSSSSSSSSTLASSSSPSSILATSSLDQQHASSTPFALRALVAVATANAHRLSLVWPRISSHLQLAATSSRSPGIRSFAVDAFQCVAHDLLLLDARCRLEEEEAAAVEAEAAAGVEAGAAAAGAVMMPQQTHGGPLDAPRPTSASNTSSATLVRSRSEFTAVVVAWASVGWLLPTGLDGVVFEDLLAAPQPPAPTRTRIATHGRRRGSTRSSSGASSGESSGASKNTGEDKENDDNDEAEGCGVPLSTATLLDPLLQVATHAHGLHGNQTDVLEQVLLAAHSLLSSCGGQMKPLWPSLFQLLLSAVEDSAAPWGGQCVALAFRSLKLVVDDFLDAVPRPHWPLLVSCTAAFGRQTSDVNVSLTAMGMLWTTVDFVSNSNPTTKRAGGGDDSDASTEDGGNAAAAAADADGDGVDVEQDDGGYDGGGGDEGAVGAGKVGTGQQRLLVSLSVWDAMLTELGNLSLDSRPEVRNCAVNTLVSAVVSANGSEGKLSLRQWRRCLQGVMLPLAVKVAAQTAAATKSGVEGASQPEVRPGVKLAMHHSRDTAHKQWSETRVLTLQGLSRLLRTAITTTATALSTSAQPVADVASRLSTAAATAAATRAASAAVGCGGGGGVATSGVSFSLAAAGVSSSESSSKAAAAAAASGAVPGDDADAKWFGAVWFTTLEIAVDAVCRGSEEQDVALAGIQLLVSAAKLASAAGLCNEPVRYGAGMRVVDGALVQVKATGKKASSSAKLSAAAAAAAVEGGVVLPVEAVATTTSLPSPSSSWGGLVVWCSAWTALVQACQGLALDDEGEVAFKLLAGLQSIFTCSADSEFADAFRLKQLLGLVASLVLPRFAAPPRKGSPAAVGYRPPFRPNVSKAQRSGLELLTNIARHLSTPSAVRNLTANASLSRQEQEQLKRELQLEKQRHLLALSQPLVPKHPQQQQQQPLSAYDVAAAAAALASSAASPFQARVEAKRLLKKNAEALVAGQLEQRQQQRGSNQELQQQQEQQQRQHEEAEAKAAAEAEAEARRQRLCERKRLVELGPVDFVWVELVAVLASFTVPALPQQEPQAQAQAERRVLQAQLHPQFCALAASTLGDTFFFSANKNNGGGSSSSSSSGVFGASSRGGGGGGAVAAVASLSPPREKLLSYVPRGYLSANNDQGDNNDGSNEGNGNDQVGTAVSAAATAGNEAAVVVTMMPESARAASFVGLVASLVPSAAMAATPMTSRRLLLSRGGDRAAFGSGLGRSPLQAASSSTPGDTAASLPRVNACGLHPFTSSWALSSSPSSSSSSSSSVPEAQAQQRFSLEPPLFESVEAARRWLAALTGDTATLPPSSSSSPSSALSSSLSSVFSSVSLCAAAMPATSVPTAIDALIAIAAPGLRSVAVNQILQKAAAGDNEQRKSGGGAYSGDDDDGGGGGGDVAVLMAVEKAMPSSSSALRLPPVHVDWDQESRHGSRHASGDGGSGGDDRSGGDREEYGDDDNDDEDDLDGLLPFALPLQENLKERLGRCGSNVQAQQPQLGARGGLWLAWETLQQPPPPPPPPTKKTKKSSVDGKDDYVGRRRADDDDDSCSGFDCTGEEEEEEEDGGGIVVDLSVGERKFGDGESIVVADTVRTLVLPTPSSAPLARSWTSLLSASRGALVPWCVTASSLSVQPAPVSSSSATAPAATAPSSAASSASSGPVGPVGGSASEGAAVPSLPSSAVAATVPSRLALLTLVSDLALTAPLHPTSAAAATAAASSPPPSSSVPLPASPPPSPPRATEAQTRVSLGAASFSPPSSSSSHHQPPSSSLVSVHQYVMSPATLRCLVSLLAHTASSLATSTLLLAAATPAAQAWSSPPVHQQVQAPPQQQRRRRGQPLKVPSSWSQGEMPLVVFAVRRLARIASGSANGQDGASGHASSPTLPGSALGSAQALSDKEEEKKRRRLRAYFQRCLSTTTTTATTSNTADTLALEALGSWVTTQLTLFLAAHKKHEGGGGRNTAASVCLPPPGVASPLKRVVVAAVDSLAFLAVDALLQLLLLSASSPSLDLALELPQQQQLSQGRRRRASNASALALTLMPLLAECAACDDGDHDGAAAAAAATVPVSGEDVRAGAAAPAAVHVNEAQSTSDAYCVCVADVRRLVAKVLRATKASQCAVSLARQRNEAEAGRALAVEAASSLQRQQRDLDSSAAAADSEESRRAAAEAYATGFPF